MTVNKQLSEADREQQILAIVQKNNSEIVEVTIPVRRGHLELVLSMCRALYHTDPRPMLQRMLESSIESMPNEFVTPLSVETIQEVYLKDPKDAGQPKPLELEHVALDDY